MGNIISDASNMNAGKSAGGGQRRSSPAPPAVSSRNLQILSKNISVSTVLISGQQQQQQQQQQQKVTKNTTSKDLFKINDKQQPPPPQQHQQPMQISATVLPKNNSAVKEEPLNSNTNTNSKLTKFAQLRRQDEESVTFNLNEIKRDSSGRQKPNTEQLLHMNTKKLTTISGGKSNLAAINRTVDSNTVIGVSSSNVASTTTPLTTNPSTAFEPTAKRLKLENRVNDSNSSSSSSNSSGDGDGVDANTRLSSTTTPQIIESGNGNGSGIVKDTSFSSPAIKEYGALEKRILAQKFLRLRSLKEK